MKRIAVINQKGGVGKTTTVANLGVALSRLDHTVLLIDLDPQAHLTLHMGVEPSAEAPGSYSLLVRSQPVGMARRRIDDHLSIIPAHMDLASAETELVSVIGRETILRDALSADDCDYDYVLIDCPPSLGVLTLNALCAVDEVIIPMQPHFLALQGVGQLLETVRVVHSRLNPELMVRGVLLCMYESTTRLSSEVVQDLKGFFDSARPQDQPWSQAAVFRTMIRRNIKLAECPSHGLSVFEYAPKSHGAEDYAALAAELRDVHRAGAVLSGGADLPEHGRMTAGEAKHNHQPGGAPSPPQSSRDLPDDFESLAHSA